MIESAPVIVVGIAPGQPEVTVRRAVDLARRVGAQVVFAVVDVSDRPVVDRPVVDGDGRTRREPTDADDHRVGPSVQRLAVNETLDRLLTDQPVTWRVEDLAGDPSRELAALADRLDAVMIVVGTRQGGLRGRVAEFFNGSIAVSLAHHQSRPVVVVPTAPVAFEKAAPWE